MIITEHLRTREDGTILIRTYSDSGYMIEREGVMYEEAIDPIEFGREYIETNVKIESTHFQQETEQDYLDTLSEMEVDLNE
jgi:hypothetical protein